jgi:hypothetical protein
MVGAKGFEPSTSWSRTKHLNPINALFGVAYGTRSVISPLSVVPNLYLELKIPQSLAHSTRLPWAQDTRLQQLHPTLLTTNVSNKSGNLLFAQR